jgi:serine protease Do
LATLDSDRNAPAIASFRLRPAELGEQVATYGFPYSGDLSRQGNFTLGYITSLQGPGDDNRVLQISAQVQPGNSGGPLLDMASNVAGVVVAQMGIQPVSIPQNVNFGIRASIAVNFLSASRISPNFAPSTTSNLSSEKLAKEAQRVAVHVLCQGTPTVASSATTSTVAAVSGTFSGTMSPSQVALHLGKVRHQTNRSLPLKARWQRLNPAHP